jgi:hypothetical protein
MMTFVGCPPDAWGFIPGYLDEADPRPARAQFDERYPGGWSPAPTALKFERKQMVLTYPGDPPFAARGALQFRGELLILFESDFVVILQSDGTWQCARMD